MTEKSLSESFAAFDRNYQGIQEQIARAAERSGRHAEDITLLAATKTVPVEVINHAISQGICCMGENRVQELLDKYPALDRERCDVQFIGQLQTNKVKYLMDKVSCIQSVDSVKLAKEISRLCQKNGLGMNVLVEVNIGQEENKGGIPPEQLMEFIDEIRLLPGIRVNGLMAIPPICSDKKELEHYFLGMRQYLVDIKGKSMDNVNMNCLSMGMSSDFALAIECGATMVRVGSSLFGAREYTPKLTL